MGASVIAAFRPRGSLKQDWRFLLLGSFLGVVPDFDYALSCFRVGGRTWHHDFTHSIIFAFLIGLMAAAVINHFNFRDVMAYFLATLSHTAMDFLFTESRGVELFWPFSGKLFKFGLQPPFPYDWRMRPLSAKVADILQLCLFELAVFATILLVILWIKGRAPRYQQKP
jgi:membrane-bound metal-dependent hydrolase YbcI (DUF457 family)